MPRRLLLLVAAYVVLALLVVGWGWLLTHPLAGSVDGTDDDISRWFADQRSSTLDPVADVGTLLGETPVGLGVAAVVAVAAWRAFRSWAAALVVVLADLGDGGIYWLGSHLDPRDRPPVHILDAGLVPDRSFPSGHTGSAVAVYGGAALLLWLWLGRREGRGGLGLVVVLLLLVPVFVMASRLYQGAHHLTDVATAAVYGAVWLAVLASVLVPRSADGLRDEAVPHR